MQAKTPKIYALTQMRVKSIWLVVFLLFINFIVASLMATHVYPKLENYLYEQYNAYLIDAKQITHQTFKQTTSSLWQDKATILADRYDTAASIVERTTENLTDETLSMLAKSQADAGFVDMQMATVYYPLTAQYALEFGPIPYSSWLSFISDWFSWLTVITLNACLLFAYASYVERQARKLTQAIIQLPMTLKKEQANEYADIYHYIKALNAYIKDMQHEHNSRLILQRDLLHGVAHEFRSPMARIQFALDMLEDLSIQAPKIEHEKLYSSMHTSLADLDKLVKELLYYARLKDSEAALNYLEVSFPALCERAIAQVSSFYPTIHFELHDNRLSNVLIEADENLMTRMMINVLRNAGRFAHAQCRIQLSMTEHHLQVLVEDDGVGIPPGKTLRIFEPFTRLDPSRSRDSGGCGLGLAIVASIVNKHQGEITVIDGKLTGACFQMTLPIHRL